MLERLFKLKEAGTDVKTEIVAGLTTFFAMCYIVFVNPAILGDAGMDKGAVTLATCIAAAVGTLVMSLYANHAFVMAPGMGINAFFAYTICGSMGYSWQAGLAAVFMSGIIFILITLLGIRQMIVNAIPNALKDSISAGIGLFISFIGIKQAGLLSFVIDPGHFHFIPFVDDLELAVNESIGLIEADATPIPAFNFSSPTTWVALFGLVVLTFLMVRNVKGGMFLSIVAATLFGAALQFGLGKDVGIVLPESFAMPSLAPTFGACFGGFGELFGNGQGIGAAIMSVISVLISLTMCDMFDTIGMLIGTANRVGMVDENGELPRMGRALMADAIGTTVGSVLGTSTITTFAESSAGFAAGGRTGLTSLTAAILFIVACFAAPILGVVPRCATAPVIIMIGVLMMGSAAKVNWDDISVAIPSFLTIACMAFAYSIADGIAAGFIFFSLAKVFQGKGKEVSPILYVVAILFVIRFAIVNA